MPIHNLHLHRIYKENFFDTAFDSELALNTTPNKPNVVEGRVLAVNSSELTPPNTLFSTLMQNLLVETTFDPNIREMAPATPNKVLLVGCQLIYWMS